MLPLNKAFMVQGKILVFIINLVVYYVLLSPDYEMSQWNVSAFHWGDWFLVWLSAQLEVSKKSYC